MQTRSQQIPSYIISEEDYQNYYNEIKCSICLDLYTDPVTGKCSHTFCYDCILNQIKAQKQKAKCPLCQKQIAKQELIKDRKLEVFIQIFRNIHNNDNNYALSQLTNSQKKSNINLRVNKEDLALQEPELRQYIYQNQSLKKQKAFLSSNQQLDPENNANLQQIRNKSPKIGKKQRQLTLQQMLENSSQKKSQQPMQQESYDISDSNLSKVSKKKRSPIHILASKLSENFIDEIKKFCRQFNNCHFYNEMNPKITHVLVNPDVTKKPKILAPRTVKYLQGVVKGAWILSVSWVVNSVGFREIQDEEEYEVTHDQYGKGAAKLSRKLGGLQSLFGGMRFYIHDLQQEDAGVSKNDIVNLIEMAGGQVISRQYQYFNKKNKNDNMQLEEESYFYVTIINKNTKINSKITQKNTDLCSVVRHQWILDSISNGKILSCKNYLN